MNVFALASSPVSAVNAPIVGTLTRGVGYATAADGSRTPITTSTPDQSFQVQALTASEIQHLDSLNITGVMQAVHYAGPLIALDRKTGGGGDIITLGDDNWLVVQILEYWPASGWTRAAIRKQVQ